MSEARAFISLPKFLADAAETQFRTNLRGGSRRRCFTCWPEAIEYLLSTYATAASMREALQTLGNILQASTEAGGDYGKSLNEAKFRCGNIHEEDEKMTYYVYGLNDTI